jgi:hypothetical protein
VGLCPTPHKPLKRLDPNFIKKIKRLKIAAPCAAIFGFTHFVKVFVELFSKSSWGLGQSPKVLKFVRVLP